MPKEKFSLSGMLCGDEPGPLARVLHTLSGNDEGKWGEKCILKLLKNRIKDTTIFQNIYVPFEQGTAELDIVLTHPTGIYVMESKALGGRIYGQPEYQKWVQYLGGSKHSFYNPVKQNKNHCLHLSEALQISCDYIFSLIVFENRADLSKVSPLREDTYIVCNREQLIEILTELLSDRKPIFSLKELDAICENLKQWSHASKEIKEQHIQQVQNHVSGNICPLCGKELVERKGKYGAFLGCNGYPKCSYTRKIT